MTSYSQLFDGIGSAFEVLLGLPPNFFLQQNQIVPANMQGSTTIQSFGRLWIDGLDAYGMIGETISDITGDTQNVLSTLQSPDKFNLIVHFYHTSAYDRAKALSTSMMDSPLTAAFNLLNLAVTSYSAVQNTGDVVQGEWRDHALLRVAFNFVDTVQTVKPVITSLGTVTGNFQLSSGQIVPVGGTS
jgi:hypothetical protein